MRINATAELDNKAVEIEFLLISVIQGLAIQLLAVAAVEPLSNRAFEFWPYIISGFTLILIFWVQAIAHALSFIRWPIDIVHTFLYLLASFFEVMAFSHITNPLKWFIFGLVFLVIVVFLYTYDLSMTKQQKQEYMNTKARKNLYGHLYAEQIREMKLFLPVAIFFNIFCIALIYYYPNVFIEQKYHVALGGMQALFGFILLKATVKAFKERSMLLT